MADVFRDLPETVKLGFIDILTRIDNLTINYVPDESINFSVRNGESSNGNHIAHVDENPTSARLLVATSPAKVLDCSPLEIEICSNTFFSPLNLAVERDELQNVSHEVAESVEKHLTSTRIFKSEECSNQIPEEICASMISESMDYINALGRTDGDDNCQLSSNTTSKERKLESTENHPMCNDASVGQKPNNLKRSLSDESGESTRSDSPPSIKRHRSSVKDPDDLTSEDYK